MSFGEYSEPTDWLRFGAAMVLGAGTTAIFAATYLRVGGIANIVINHLLVEAMHRPDPPPRIRREGTRFSDDS